jgi:hypothetical protein
MVASGVNPVLLQGLRERGAGTEGQREADGNNNLR